MQTIQPHLPDALRCRRISHADLEAVNGVIETAKRMARGYREGEHFKIAIYSPRASTH